VVAQALARQPDPTLAARSDPWTVDRQLRHLIAEHERFLAGRPTDPGETLAEALKELAEAEAWLTETGTVAAHSARQVDRHGALAGLSRRSRTERRDQRESFAVDRQRAQEAKDRRDDVAARVAALQRDRNDLDKFDRAEGWRRWSGPDTKPCRRSSTARPTLRLPGCAGGDATTMTPSPPPKPNSPWAWAKRACNMP
jgi:hypothetical protein